MLSENPDVPLGLHDFTWGAKAPPRTQSRRRPLVRTAGLLLLLVALTAADWSPSSKYRTLGQHPRGLWALAFSPDGKTLYSACRDDKNPRVAGKVWDLASGRERRNFPGGKIMALWPGGGLVATSDGASQTITVWDIAKGKKRVTLRKTPTRLERILFSPNGKMLAVVGARADDQPGRISLWELASGKQVREFGHWDTGVSGLSFGPDGKTLASCGWDGSVQLWEVKTGTEVTTFRKGEKTRGSVQRVTFSPDGRYLAAVRRDVVVWEVATRKRVATLPWGGYGPPLALAFSPDSRFLAAGGKYAHLRYLQGCRVVLWDVGTWRKRSETELPAPVLAGDTVWCLAFSPDGSRLAVGSYLGYVGLLEKTR